MSNGLAQGIFPSAVAAAVRQPFDGSIDRPPVENGLAAKAAWQYELSGYPHGMDIPEIDSQAAAVLHQEGAALFLDVRDEQSFQAAHIPGAVRIDDATIQEFLANADRERMVVVYCYHGHSSRGGTAFLLDNGFSDVCSLRGGFEDWRTDHPIETSKG